MFFLNKFKERIGDSSSPVHKRTESISFEWISTFLKGTPNKKKLDTQTSSKENENKKKNKVKEENNCRYGNRVVFVTPHHFLPRIFLFFFFLLFLFLLSILTKQKKKIINREKISYPSPGSIEKRKKLLCQSKQKNIKKIIRIFVFCFHRTCVFCIPTFWACMSLSG